MLRNTINTGTHHEPLIFTQIFECVCFMKKGIKLRIMQSYKLLAKFLPVLESNRPSRSELWLPANPQDGKTYKMSQYGHFGKTAKSNKINMIKI